MANKHTLKNRQIVFDKFDGRCAYCGTEVTLEVDRFDPSKVMQIDHFQPRMKKVDPKFLEIQGMEKGTNKINNLYPACKGCTASKKDRTIEEWREILNNMVNWLFDNSSQFRTVVRFGLVNTISRRVEFYFEKRSRH